MSNQPLSTKLLLALSVLMILAGAGLGIWTLVNNPFGQPATVALGSDAQPASAAPAASGFTETRPTPPAADADAVDAAAGSAPTGTEAAPGAASAQPTGAQPPPIVVTVASDNAPGSLPVALMQAALPVSNTVLVTTTVTTTRGPAAISLGLEPVAGAQPFTVTFAAATRFDTVDPQITWPALQQAWSRGVTTYTQIAVLSDTLPALAVALGKPGPAVQGYATAADVTAAAWQDRTTLALLPFEQLTPRLVVLAVDGQNPIDNAAHYDPARYPLIVPAYAHVTAKDLPTAQAARQLLAALPSGNRVAEHLTVVAMTGVTAMCRQTAAQMDRLGSAWPAEVVGPELAAADITAISNEVPFVPGCETNTSPDNLNFCSKPEYMQALTASGVDIIGLTGNHQNDYGLENALKSLDIYDKADLPVYGGGRNKQAAFKPLIIEHNGNRLAFLGANSYGPKFAWATDTQPGSAQFDLAIMSALIRGLKQNNQADVVLAELQYQESYDTQPLLDQRQDFNALVRAGADIVTGVQSHVPQGIEFTDDKLVLYGLGNLYFDQMFQQSTREGMIVKHTIYEGRHISTQVLTTLLYDFGQPRWTTPEQRTSLLDRVFAASYW